MELKVGDAAPAFTLPATGNRSVGLKTQGWMVLYFYPKADTSGCTKQAEAFQTILPALEAMGATLCGVSPDPLPMVERFAAKYSLTFPLAADPEKTVLQAYGVWVEKSMYGRKYMGVERTTFLIGPDGHIERIWPKVKIPDHATTVMDALRQVAAPADSPV